MRPGSFRQIIRRKRTHRRAPPKLRVGASSTPAGGEGLGRGRRGAATPRLLVCGRAPCMQRIGRGPRARACRDAARRDRSSPSSPSSSPPPSPSTSPPLPSSLAPPRSASAASRSPLPSSRPATDRDRWMWRPSSRTSAPQPMFSACTQRARPNMLFLFTEIRWRRQAQTLRFRTKHSRCCVGLSRTDHRLRPGSCGDHEAAGSARWAPWRFVPRFATCRWPRHSPAWSRPSTILAT
jgi:hypothetical protein